ncbi:MAG: alpha/beta hydrolase-fold protein [Verrucomicrobiota bacterium]
MKYLPLLFCAFSLSLTAAEPEFPLTADSKPQAEVAKGTLIKDSYTAPESSVFPGTVREYQIYLPVGFDKTKPAHFMVFQDGLIYQAPVVFDNLIAKKDIPSLVGIFIKPGVVPAANDNALPRFNRSYEYDSITPTYSKFLIEEFLPALEKKHAISLSQDPNHAAISGNSSGGICAFMVAWHRPDRFRRVFTGVGTYVGIHGADQLPVLVRKIEPKPLRIYLQSGTGDNNLYCGDWWMANQMMERSLTWAGYDVNHAWGEGGHNGKHATQIFPDVLRWLWRDWQTDIEVKANPKGESKWKGYEVVEGKSMDWTRLAVSKDEEYETIAANAAGLIVTAGHSGKVHSISSTGHIGTFCEVQRPIAAMAFAPNGDLVMHTHDDKLGQDLALLHCAEGKVPEKIEIASNYSRSLLIDHKGVVFLGNGVGLNHPSHGGGPIQVNGLTVTTKSWPILMCLSPDQTLLYGFERGHLTASTISPEGELIHTQEFHKIVSLGEAEAGRGWSMGEMCVDTEGRLYVATTLGIQVCDQAGRVNFIIPTPKPAHDVCFGGKDLSELFIACGDTIYKRPTKVHGVVSGQQAPIKPAPPKL